MFISSLLSVDLTFGYSTFVLNWKDDTSVVRKGRIKQASGYTEKDGEVKVITTK